MRIFALFLLFFFLSYPCISQEAPSAYPSANDDIDFHFHTVRTDAKGSDIWPVTWAADDKLYTAWGDGKGFSGTGKVSWGIAEINGTPDDWTGKDIYYGPPGSGKGKISGLLAIDNILYAWKNTQNRTYPWCDIVLIRSADQGNSWSVLPVKFGRTGFKPMSFINYGRGYEGARDQYVYILGFKAGEQEHNVYLARVAQSQLARLSSYEYFTGTNESNRPVWKKDPSLMTPILKGWKGEDYFSFPVIIYNAGLQRYILTDCHGKMGKVGIFESKMPWGPWKTIYFNDHWGNLNKGEYLGFEFPNKWTSTDGKKLGMVFSVYDSDNEKWNDACNTMRVTLTTR